MKSLREKISFIVTACCYVLFHVRLGASLAEVLVGTLEQLLTTAPYAIGFSYMIAAFIRRISDGEWPPWDRIARIFFTIGIFFAFFFALYEYAERGAPASENNPAAPASEVELNSPVPAPASAPASAPDPDPVPAPLSSRLLPGETPAARRAGNNAPAPAPAAERVNESRFWLDDNQPERLCWAGGWSRVR